MILGDIIALARAGYTPADIREFLAADVPAKQEPDNMEPKEAPAEKTDDDNTVDTINDHDSDPKNAPEAPAEELDYKKMYEDSQAALKKAQAANTHKELPAEKSAQEIVNDLFKECI